jgi:hypothetical protein
MAAPAEQATSAAAHLRAIGNGRSYVQAPQPIRVPSGANRLPKVFMRPSLRRQLHSAETALEKARARLVRLEHRAAARNRQAQASAAPASALRNAQDALDATLAKAKTKSAGLERRIARARQRLAAAQRSTQASQQSLQAGADRAQRSLERARAATATDRVQLDKLVADAERKLATAQASARSRGEQLQAAVDAARQTLDATKNSQAQNAQAYQSDVAAAGPFAGKGMFTAWDPEQAIRPGVDWIAVQPEQLTAEIAAAIKANGSKLVIWEPKPSAAGAAAVKAYNADGYIAQAESQGELNAALSIQDLINVPKALVTNNFMASWPVGWIAMPEAYTQANPQATPENVIFDSRSRGAKVVIPILGSYEEGGRRVSVGDYAGNLARQRVAGVGSYTAETLTQDDWNTFLGEPGVKTATLESTVTADQAAVALAESALANAQQAQSAGQVEDERRVQAAQDALATAQASAASDASASQATVSNAKRSLDPASSTRDSRLSRDGQTVVQAQSSLASARRKRGSGRSSGELALRSARQALASAQTAGRSTVAQTEREVDAAAVAVRNAQQSLGSALAASSSFVNAPTASDLAVAETKVELAQVGVVSARDHIAKASELRAPVAGTVAGSSSGSVSLTGLDSQQVKVSPSAEEAARAPVTSAPDRDRRHLPYPPHADGHHLGRARPPRRTPRRSPAATSS